MSRVINCDTWEKFLSELSKLSASQQSDDRLLPDLLFRGHADASWKLETTLDRMGRKAMLFSEYYRQIAVAQAEIEAFTAHRWTLPYYPDIEGKFRDWDFISFNKDLHTSMYGYMAHMRHHGYPSPLFDWTRSVYVAAYFAFARPAPHEQVSIYVLAQAKMSSARSGKPQVVTLGPNVRTHKRHFLQQCEYSLCVQFDESWAFADHETAFEENEADNQYPVNSTIYKFNLPSRERLNVLRLLDSMNLNAFSLFGSEESLMETLALRELTLKQDNS